MSNTDDEFVDPLAAVRSVLSGGARTKVGKAPVVKKTIKKTKKEKVTASFKMTNDLDFMDNIRFKDLPKRFNTFCLFSSPYVYYAQGQKDQKNKEE